MNYRIMAVPWNAERADNAERVASVLGAEIIWDEDRVPEHTLLRMLDSVGDRAAIFLEDDVVLTSDFAVKANAVIARYGHRPIQFYSNRAADLTVGSRWEPGRSFLATLCWYLPPLGAADLAGFLPTWDGTRWHHEYDRGVAAWMQSLKLKYWLHVPSLVQHMALPSSVNPKRGRGRTSRSFLP